jgi:hypothetical protein
VSVVVDLSLPVYAQGEYVAFPETVSVSSPDLVPHNFILKAISKQNGDVEKVSGFKLDPINVISVLGSGIISATSTDEVIVFEQAKAKSSTDSLFELQKTTATQGQQQPQQNNGFSLTGLAPGVYTLDIIVAKNNAKAAYEGILVIGQNAQSQEVKQVVEREIIEVEQDTPTTIIPVFQPPSNPQPGPPIILQQQQQPAAIPLGGQAPVNPPSPPPQALAGQQPPNPATTTAAPQSDTPPDGTPCTGVDNVDVGVYKDGKCTPETLPPEPPQAPATDAALPRGTIPSCILTADCPRSPPPQALAAQQPSPPPSPPPSTSSSAESDNENGSDPCLLDPSSPECQVVDTFETPSETQSCPTGTQGTPPECSPVQPGNEPVELASTDPNDPLAGEAGQTGEGSEDEETREGEDGTGDTDELARESQDTDEEDSESDSESDSDGKEGGDGDGGDNDSGDSE